HWEPQPDVVLLKPRDDFYTGAHPRPEDVLLVVEVAETSLGYERRLKLPEYARVGVPEVWLLDLPGDGLEVLRGPAPQGYRDVRRLNRGARVAPQALPDVELSVDDLLG
ncbi:MAG: Uma2 family endonuclease, partial [Gemmatimonadota bacterium]